VCSRKRRRGLGGGFVCSRKRRRGLGEGFVCSRKRRRGLGVGFGCSRKRRRGLGGGFACSRKRRLILILNFNLKIQTFDKSVFGQRIIVSSLFGPTDTIFTGTPVSVSINRI
jgi:hypothetical protein